MIYDARFQSKSILYRISHIVYRTSKADLTLEIQTGLAAYQHPRTAIPAY